MNNKPESISVNVMNKKPEREAFIRYKNGGCISFQLRSDGNFYVRVKGSNEDKYGTYKIPKERKEDVLDVFFE